MKEESTIPEKLLSPKGAIVCREHISSSLFASQSARIMPCANLYLKFKLWLWQLGMRYLRGNKSW
jgi:hypothetical protein